MPGGMGRTSTTSALKLRVAADYAAMSAQAAALVKTEVQRTPDLLLCASAGGTPTGMYELLTQAGPGRSNLFSQVRLLQINECLGLPRGHPATCQSDLRQKLALPLGLRGARFLAFRSDALNPERECARVARGLNSHGPIGLCILGLGANGHVAMNEPGPSLVPGVHVTELTPSSRAHPMLNSLHVKPTHGLTLGMGDILRSQKILLLVSGRKKCAALKKLLAGRVTTQFPASLLWLHPHTTVLCDRPAMGG